MIKTPMVKPGMILKHEGFYDDFEYGELFYVIRFKPKVCIHYANETTETTMISFKTGMVVKILHVDYDITRKEWTIVYSD